MPRENLIKAEKFEKKMNSFHEQSQKQAFSSHSPNLNVLLSRIRAVSSSLIRDYNELENLQIATKSPERFVSNSISYCQKKLHAELSKARPSYGFFFNGKEEIDGEDTSHRFLCDIINGQSNFAHSIPFFCISVAIEENKEIINSVVFNPITDELFYAEKGKGAFIASGRGNIRLKVAQRNSFDNAIISSSDLDKTLHKHLRQFGSPALTLAYVAAGKIDACWEYEVNPCSIAAGVLLVREAGGHIKSLTTSYTKDKDIVYSSDIFASSDKILPLLNGKI